MPKKRRNNGRGKKNQGHTKPVLCSNCGRLTPKDKAIKKFAIRDIIDASSKEDIMQVQHYPKFFLPKTHIKNYYCVSCACHARIVKVRSTEERRVRNVRQVVMKKKDTPNKVVVGEEAE